MFHGKHYTIISIPICICANYSKISMMSNAKLTKLDRKNIIFFIIDIVQNLRLLIANIDH